MEPQTWTDYFLGFIPSLIIILLWLLPVLMAFARLRRHKLDETAKAVWVLIILFAPVVGSLTYLLLFSSKKISTGNEPE